MLPLMEENNGGGNDLPAGDPATPPSGLPSDNQPPAEGAISFEIKPEDLTDGKFGGKWESPQQMADHIKAIEDKHANLTRDIANNSKKDDADIAATAAELKTKQLQMDTVKDILPDFLKNGMVVTPEMQAELTATGLTEQDIKLGAYEFKEAVDKNAGYVGGKENYDIIMNHHAETMSPEEKTAFNHSIQDPNNSEALMVGLQTMYEKSLVAGEQATTPDRIRGNTVKSQGVQPYATKAELMADKKYADSKASSAGDKAKYKARLGITPDEVWLS